MTQKRVFVQGLIREKFSRKSCFAGAIRTGYNIKVWSHRSITGFGRINRVYKLYCPSNMLAIPYVLFNNHFLSTSPIEQMILGSYLSPRWNRENKCIQPRLNNSRFNGASRASRACRATPVKWLLI